MRASPGRTRDARDQPMQAEAAQVVGHPAWGEVAGVAAQERGEMRPQVTRGEPVGQETVEDQDAQERLHARVSEGQGRDALVTDHLGAGHPPEGVLAKQAIMAELLDVEQTSVGGEADRRWINQAKLAA